MIRSICFIICIMVSKLIFADTVTTPIRQFGFGRVSCAAFSPTTPHFATGCFDDKLRIHDVVTGDLVRTLTLPEKNKNFKQTWWIYSVSFSKDGKMLISNSSDNKVLLWNTSTGELIQTFSGHDSGVCTAVLSDDKKMVLSGGSDGSVRLWNVTSGAMVGAIQLEQSVYKHFPFVTETGFSHNGKTCFYTSSGMTKLVNLPDFKVVMSFSGEDVQFTPNDSAIIYTVEDSIIYLNLYTEEQQSLYNGKGGKLTAIELSNSGLFVYVNDHRDDSLRNYIKKIDLQTRSVTELFTYQYGDPAEIYFSTGMEVCLTVSDDALVELIDLKSGKLLKKFEYYSSLANSIALSRDGKSAFIGYQFWGIKQWSINDEKLIKSFFIFEPPIKTVGIPNDNSKVIATYLDDTTRIWNVSDGSIVKKLYYHDENCSVSSSVISSDGKKALIANRNSVDLWDVETGMILKTISVTAQSNSSSPPSILCLSFSPGDSLVLVGLNDYSARLFRISDGEQIMSYGGHKSIVNSVAMSPDGSKIITSSVDSTAIVWNSRTRNPILQILKGHGKIVTVAKFSNSGMYALTGSIDNTARLWDIATGRELRVFPINHEFVIDVAFSPNDKSVIVCTSNGTSRLYDISDLQSSGIKTQKIQNSTLSINSFRGVIRIKYNHLAGVRPEAQLNIFTINGKSVARYEFNMAKECGDIKFPLHSNMSSGTYYYRLDDGFSAYNWAFSFIR